MSKYAVERSRHSGEVERFDEQACVSDLAAAAAAHPAPKLLLGTPSLPRRLFLEGAKGAKISLSVSHLLHGLGTERADQLVLQVSDAHVEPETFHIGAGEVGAEAGTLETTSEVALLSGVTETRQPQIEPLRAEPTQEPSDGLRTPDRDDRHALGVEITAAALSERFERTLIADSFDQHDRTRVDCLLRSRLGHSPYVHSARALTSRLRKRHP